MIKSFAKSKIDFFGVSHENDNCGGFKKLSGADKHSFNGRRVVKSPGRMNTNLKIHSLCLPLNNEVLQS